MIHTLERTPGIFMVGFMGCGKSTIGRALADEVGWSFFDLDEQIEDWCEVAIADLPHVADFLDDLNTEGTQDIGGDWRAWGKFRAVVHRAVHQALASV